MTPSRPTSCCARSTTTAYVNYGLWEAGAESVEPGRRLAELAADALSLEPGGRLLDVGSGLGQAAVDLALRHRPGARPRRGARRASR